MKRLGMEAMSEAIGALKRRRLAAFSAVRQASSHFRHRDYLQQLVCICWIGRIDRRDLADQCLCITRFQVVRPDSYVGSTCCEQTGMFLETSLD